MTKTEKILSYWKYLCQFSPVEAKGKLYKEIKKTEDKILNEKRYLKFSLEHINEIWKYNFEKLKADIEVVYGNALISDLYELIELDESEKVEIQTGKTFLFILEYDKEGKYIEESFKISNFFLLLISLGNNKSFANNGIKIVNDFNNKIDEHIKDNVPLFSYENFKKIIEYVFNNLPLITNKIKNRNYYLYIKNKNEDKESDTGIMQMDFYSEDLNMILKKGISKNKFLGNIIEAYSNERIKIDDNEEFIKKITRPENYPLVKWPSKYNPSLMQTVAINIATGNYKENEVFSVNGPPGTGKTTLLKEIIADNIFKRAEAISKLGLKCFERKKIESAEEYYKNYYEIPEELKKLGIIVASNNNSAVENISKDLPKALKDTLTNNFDLEVYKKDQKFENNENSLKPREIYFTESANRLFGGENEYWGLISSPYGKSENIKKLYPIINGKYNEKNKKDIFTLSENNKPDFEKAKEEFRTKLEEVKKMQEEMSKKAKEILKLEEADKESILKELEEIRIKLREFQKEVVEQLNKKKLLEEKKSNLKDEYIFFGLIKKQNTEKESINRQINGIIDNLIKKSDEIKNIENKKEETEKILEKIGNYNELKQEYLNSYSSGKEHPFIVDKNFFDNIERNEKSQEVSPWIFYKWNKLREELFFRSLMLLKAFVLNSNEIKQNLRIFRNVKEGEKTGYNEKEREKVLKEGFHTLNLVIPVLSTTFASVRRAFKNFGECELGTVIIDEAGQATPFSSMGLLYRARRCVIVGDPLQVEPVITIPATLNRILIEKFDINKETRTFRIGSSNEEKGYGNSSISIQTLADFANRYYGKIGKTYVGCPLVVHRRCESPMFDISNEISYDNRMINKCETEKDEKKIKNYVIQKNEFMDIAGKEKGNGDHFVEEQGKKVISIINDALNKEISVFDLKYLCIISPFKSVEKGIRKMLDDEYSTKFEGEKREKLKKWIKESVGTVHKFQGKEADSVIMVLGCDSSSENAAIWASNQANILNVAVTRAKRRLVIIGEKKLWNKLPNFDKAIEILERVQK